jgi:hypothetical protein
MYLPVSEITGQLISVQPFRGALAADPRLRGITGISTAFRAYKMVKPSSKTSTIHCAHSVAPSMSWLSVGRSFCIDPGVGEPVHHRRLRHASARLGAVVWHAAPAPHPPRNLSRSTAAC